MTAAAIFTIYSVPLFAQSASAPSTTCVQPPGPGAQIVPTRIFPPVEPNGAKPRLANPLKPASTSRLTMLTLGDSAIWGNGLNNRDKYTHKVAQDIANGTGRTVNLISFAHSGANIANEANSNYEPLVPSDGGTPPGDLNAGLPTTIQQEACAATDKRSSGAEIILLDGCINDVGAEKIALPFPLSGATVSEIKQRAHQWCSDKMVALLQSTKADFPYATIIVSNYWLIISDKSSPIGVATRKSPATGATAIQRDQRSLVETERKAEDLTGQLVTDVQLFSDRKALLRKWSDNSLAFLDTSQGCFAWAIATVNGTSTAPNDVGGAHTDYQCPSVPPPGLQPTTQDFRVFLATVSRDPLYSYGARKKRIWSVPIPIIRPDELYDERAVLCKTHYAAGDLGDRFICPINPTAHPDVRGSEAFRQSITHIIEAAWKSS
jgi:lysophospholipase L1-like esterase